MTKGNCSLKIIKLTQQAHAHATPPELLSSHTVGASLGHHPLGRRVMVPTVPLKPETDLATPFPHPETAGLGGWIGVEPGPG